MSIFMLLRGDNFASFNKKVPETYATSPHKQLLVCWLSPVIDSRNLSVQS